MGIRIFGTFLVYVMDLSKLVKSNGKVEKIKMPKNPQNTVYSLVVIASLLMLGSHFLKEKILAENP